MLIEQKAVLSHMLELSKQERQAISSGDSVELESVVRLQLRELSQLGRIEKRRAALNDAIASELGITGQKLTVSAIALKAKPDERKEIVALQTELTELVHQHNALNLENRELIKEHLEYSEAMIELMTGSDDPLNNFYGANGKATGDRKTSTGLFNRHA